MESIFANEPTTADKDKDAVIERFARHVSSGKVAFFRQAGIDFVLGRRQGAYLWDLSGEKKSATIT
jgi:hypothetical protein